jgi:hypothetical protein
MERTYELRQAMIADIMLMLNLLNNSWVVRKTKTAITTADKEKNSLKPKILKNTNQGENIIAVPRR